MKRVMISVDLEDNEVLEKAVKEAVRDSAKQIAREQIDNVLKAEVIRVVTKQVQDIQSSGWGRCSRLESMAKDEVNRIVKEAIGEVEIPKDAVEMSLKEILSTVERKVDRIIADKVTHLKIEDYIAKKSNTGSKRKSTGHAFKYYRKWFTATAAGRGKPLRQRKQNA